MYFRTSTIRSMKKKQYITLSNYKEVLTLHIAYLINTFLRCKGLIYAYLQRSAVSS